MPSEAKKSSLLLIVSVIVAVARKPVRLGRYGGDAAPPSLRARRARPSLPLSTLYPLIARLPVRGPNPMLRTA